MAWAFVQDDGAVVDDATSATTIAKAFTSNVTAGNHIYVWCGWSNSDTNPTVADSLGNTYALLGARVFDATNSQGMAQFHAENITGGACTVTVTFGASVPYRRIGIIEHSGIATASSTDGTPTGQVVATPGTGTDGASSGNITVAANSLVIGAYQNINEASPGSPTITQGTGYTARELSGVGIGRMEDKNGSAGATAATFTLSSSQRSIVMVAAFKEPAAGGGIAIPIITRQFRARWAA